MYGRGGFLHDNKRKTIHLDGDRRRYAVLRGFCEVMQVTKLVLITFGGVGDSTIDTPSIRA